MRIRTTLIMAAALLFALPAGAATLAIETVRSDGGWIRADVVLDPGHDDLNAVSGTLTFDAGRLELKLLEDQSVIPLWVERPAFARTGEVDFAGVVPGGFDAGRSVLFSVLFQEAGTGKARIGLRDALALKDDGQATPAALTIVPSELEVDGSQPGDPVPAAAASRDSDPPEPFDPQVARDEALFDGAWFIAFAAQDKGSGIAWYDVIESLTFVETALIESGRWLSAESPYRLQDQTRNSWIYVRAMDRNGNARVERLPPAGRPSYQVWGILAACVLIAIAAIRLVRRRRSS